MRSPEERFFTASDGTCLFYRYWPPIGGPASQAVVLLGQLQDLVDGLDLPRMAMFAWDTAGTLVKDVDVFVHHISSGFGIALRDIAVLGENAGSVLAATWVHDYAPPIRCMVLASPASGLFPDRVIEDAQAIQTPTLVLMPGADSVGRRFFDHLGSKVKEKQVFEGFYHDKVREFLQKCFSQPPLTPSLADADRNGYTKDEFDRLSRPLPRLSPKALSFGSIRLGMRTSGRLSDGIRLGLATGFDSGSTLDYVYRNQPSGITPLGRLIDRSYLNAIGWRGIRVRKQNLERLLRQAIAALRAAGRPVRIADIAAGHGRYVLEAIETEREEPDHILLRDFSEINVRAGERLIRQKGMEAIAQFEKGDAFDRASVAAIAPRPTLGIVSGLYELFPDNAPVRESLAGFAEAIEPGGYLLYTGQPWHPQLEMIARTLASHRGHKPWIMRRRTQAEIDQLVQAAGFRKIEQLIDDWGIFSVSMAQRTGV